MQESQQTDNEGLIGIISYLTLLGWLIAYFVLVPRYGKTDIDMFHMRQSLGLQICGIVLSFVAIFIGTLTSSIDWFFHVLAVVLLIFWVIGFVGAINLSNKPLPGVGKFFDETFSGVR